MFALAHKFKEKGARRRRRKSIQISFNKHQHSLPLIPFAFNHYLLKRLKGRSERSEKPLRISVISSVRVRSCVTAYSSKWGRNGASLAAFEMTFYLREFSRFASPLLSPHPNRGNARSSEGGYTTLYCTESFRREEGKDH